MELSGRVVVITGGAGGIGAAMARRFAAEGAEAVIVADLDAEAAGVVADDIGTVATAAAVDVTDAGQVAALVAQTEQRYGRIDLFCANAGVTSGVGLDGDFDRAWQVNVMGHLHAARAVLPGMLARGEGYLLQTCSAAGLLTSVGDAAYATTKHAAVGLAEWLAVTYGDRGIRVSALCPQGVDTPMLSEGLAAGHLGARVTAAAGAVLAPEQVAQAVVEGIEAERFLILPHPQVALFHQRKAENPDGWLTAMRTMVRRFSS